MLLTATRHLVLDELAVDSGPIELADDVRLALEDTKLVVARGVGGDRWMLLPNGYVGATQIGDLLVEVTPKDKVGMSQILFFLSYAADPGFRPENTEAEAADQLWAALGESLVRLGERATKRGVLQGYVSEDETVRTVRGRIRMSDQITQRPRMMFPIEVTRDEYTADIPENRILKAAVRRMLAVPRLTERVRRRLLHLDSMLHDVSGLVRGGSLPPWQRSRQNAGYVPALRIAEVILQNLVAEAALGRIHVASFVVNMAKVFEDFVTIALGEALRKYPGRTMGQYKTHLDGPRADGAPRIVMRPDIVHMIDDAPALIFDAKYKAATAGGQYPNADHYQMLAYAIALGQRHSWLLYAGAGAPRDHEILRSVVTTHERTLDIRMAPTDIISRIDSIAAEAYMCHQVGS